MLLEIINSLALSFLLTESALNQQRSAKQVAADEDKKQHGARRAGWLSPASYKLWHWVAGGTALANIVLSSTGHWVVSHGSEQLAAALAWIEEALSSTLHVVATPGRLLLFQAGTALTLTAVVAALAGLGLAGYLLQHGKAFSRTHKAGLAGFGLSVFLLLRLTGVDRVSSRHQEATRALVAVALFPMLCYLDVRRFQPAVTPASFVRDLAIAVAYVLPVIPCLAVAVSTVFFLLVVMLEAVGLDPHFLNSAIYYGTLYGPFAVVYFEAKKRSIRASSGGILPSAASQGIGGWAGKAGVDSKGGAGSLSAARSNVHGLRTM